MNINEAYKQIEKDRNALYQITPEIADLNFREEAGKSIIDKEIEDLEKIKAYADDRIKQLELKKKIQ